MKKTIFTLVVQNVRKYSLILKHDNNLDSLTTISGDKIRTLEMTCLRGTYTKRLMFGMITYRDVWELCALSRRLRKIEPFNGVDCQIYPRT